MERFETISDKLYFILMNLLYIDRMQGLFATAMWGMACPESVSGSNKTHSLRIAEPNPWVWGAQGSDFVVQPTIRPKANCHVVEDKRIFNE
jgi:hypothetical protein